MFTWQLYFLAILHLKHQHTNPCILRIGAEEVNPYLYLAFIRNLVGFWPKTTNGSFVIWKAVKTSLRTHRYRIFHTCFVSIDHYKMYWAGIASAFLMFTYAQRHIIKKLFIYQKYRLKLKYSSAKANQTLIFI